MAICRLACPYNTLDGCKVKAYGGVCPLTNTAQPFTEYKMTNADRIRSMNDEELAAFLCNFRSYDADEYICEDAKRRSIAVQDTQERLTGFNSQQRRVMLTVAKYINREALVEWLKRIPLKDLSDGLGLCRIIMEDDFKKAIKNMPKGIIVDAVPVSELEKLRDYLYAEDLIFMRGLAELNKLIAKYGAKMVDEVIE